jgi:hypothetical protein
MRATKTLRPNFRPQQNYDSDEENEVDYESDSSGSHNALLRHVQKSLANTDKVVAALVGTAVLLTAGAFYISHKEKQVERSDYQTATRQGHENSARRRLKRCEEPPTRDHHSSSRKVALSAGPLPIGAASLYDHTWWCSDWHLLRSDAALHCSSTTVRETSV